MTVTTRNERVSAWRHARAIALLPFMNTVVIPAALLAAFPLALTLNATTVAAMLIGAALVAGGVALVAHSIGLFVRLGRGTLAPWDPTRQLVGAGAYGYTRNPMKGGLFLVLAGEAFLTQSAPLAAWFACFALANVLYIRLHEEPGLEARFGDPYRDYCARVPRWWPRLRSPHRKATEVNAT
jgi:protein-S-isoprenylcysteine O-methyltransferase Ste14